MKSVKILLRFFCIMIALMISRAAEQCKLKNSKSKTNEIHQLNDLCEKEANLIIDFLDDQIEVLPFAKYEEVVFVFGAEQTNKTTLVLFLTDAELEAVESSPGSKEIILIDKDGPLNDYHPNIDSDLIPELIPNKESGIEFYVMPEHTIKTDTEHDITRTHITQRLFKFAIGIKFLFVINYESVKNGDAATDEEREEIRQLTQNATDLIKDIDKYKDSIALVVTHYNSSSAQYEDEFEYINIVKVLEKVQKEFDQKSKAPGISEEEKQKYIKNVQFIQIFRNDTVDEEDDSTIYTKIGIFRLANQTGMVRDIEYLQNEKYHIRAIIQENIEYTQKGDDDFYYSLQDESRAHIPELMEITEERLLSDTLNINLELKDIHVQYEKQNVDLKEMYETMKTGFEIISKIDSTDPRKFVKQVLEAAEILKVEVSNDRINTILKHIEFMDFMEELENISPMRRYKVKNGVEETNQYLEDSMDWYSFLMELHDNLSKYEVQKNVIEYESNVTYVIEMSTIEEYEEKDVSDIALKELLELLGISIPPNIESMTVNFYKLRSLEYVLNRTMLDQATPYCSPGKIEVKGYNVKISSYNEMECEGNITFIDIFAINNLFIDADIKKTGEQVQLFIIAPTWEIIGNREFVLNGKHADPHSPDAASNGKPDAVDGIAGEPGKPGGAAGCFLAIGNKFTNDKNLKIYLNGGNGGIGQHGGHGYKGIKGQDPIVPQPSYQAVSTWKKNDFDYRILIENISIRIWFVQFILYLYWVDGKPAKPPGDGGNGGYGGFGGSEGKTFCVGVDRDPEFQIINNLGKNGTNGTGGNGGAGTNDGDSYLLLYADIYAMFILTFSFPVYLYTETGKWHNKGLSGINGGNMEDIQDPDLAEFIDPALTINRYKGYLRENLPNNIQESTLRKFMKDFEFDKRVLDLYDTIALYDELKLMEDQYLQLRYDLPFMPFHESLLNRTGEYANSKVHSPDHIKVLTFIYTAISGKISNLRNFRQHVIIIDLLEYLELVQKNIDRMRETEKEISIEEQKKQYENALMEKVESALRIIESEVIPALMNVFNDIMAKIPKLIEEVLKKKAKAEKELQELQDEIRWFKVLSAFKVLAKFAEFFGKMGKTLSKAIQAGVAVIDAVRKPLQRLINGITSIVTNLIDFLKEVFDVYRDQLIHINILIFNLPGFDEARKYVLVAIGEIDKILESNNIRDFITDLIAKIRTEVRKLLYEADEQLVYGSVNYSKNKENATAAKDTNDILDTTKAGFEEIKKRNDQLKKYAEQERKLEAELAKWKQRLQDIMYKLLPTFVELQETIVKMTMSLEDQTQFELDITGWKVQTAVGDIKLLFNEMAEGTTIRDKLERDIEKIDETFAVLIKIYDRIQAYMEQAKFAAYIAGINSPNSVNIGDQRLRDLVLQLKYLLQTNIVMDQYEIAIHSFKQHQFPFAHIHLATFNLPTGLESNDTTTIVRRASDEITYLQEQTKFLDISIGKYDREIFGNIDFNSDDGSIAVPFYTFRSREYKEDIQNLLKGEEIMIKADIKNALNQNAVKFNEIGINLKLVDGKSGEQSKLNAELEKFGVRMTMVGHNYYRCGNKFYYLPVDDNCVIEYSFKRNKNGKPIKYNDVYRKLSDKHFFLSPYAMWQIKLVNIFDDFELKNQSVQSTPNAFDNLYKYRDESMNLEILGRGQYFRAEGLFANEVCTEEIEKYYDFDRRTADTNVEETKRIYSL